MLLGFRACRPRVNSDLKVCSWNSGLDVVPFLRHRNAGRCVSAHRSMQGVLAVRLPAIELCSDSAPQHDLGLVEVLLLGLVDFWAFLVD